MAVQMVLYSGNIYVWCLWETSKKKDHYTATSIPCIGRQFIHLYIRLLVQTSLHSWFRSVLCAYTSGYLPSLEFTLEIFAWIWKVLLLTQGNINVTLPSNDWQFFIFIFGTVIVHSLLLSSICAQWNHCFVFIKGSQFAAGIYLGILFNGF